MAAKVKSFSRTLVWIIVGLLIVGLAGFGATNLGGTIRTVGQVGDQPIGVDEFARELQGQVRVVEAQTGRPLQMAEVRELGIDQLALARLVQMAALDNEASRMGLSIGDGNLQKEILEIPAFQGLDGKFDREGYRFALDRANLNEAEFEANLRAEAARSLVQGAITGGVEMPAAMTDLLIEFAGARRSFTWAAMDEDALETPVAEPSEADLQAYYDANQEAFMLPETRNLTYAILTPEMELDSVLVDEDAIRTLFDERHADYSQPERRLVERLVFADDAAAEAAMAQIEVGGASFETLVQDRGLTLEDVDLGDLSADDLGAAAEAVFAAETGAVVGPLPTGLGPALFRVNGIVEAQETTFEDVRDELRDELAGEQARRQIDGRVEALEDLLAGGATLEELTAETEMELGTMGWTDQTDAGPAAYAAFNEAASSVGETDFPEILHLEDGGIFALRLDGVLPPRPEPFDAAREKVAEAWHRAEVQKALTAQADAVVAELATNGDFTATGLAHKVENGLTRTAYVDGTPAGFMNDVFEMEKGELRVLPGEDGIVIVRLDDILPADRTGELERIGATVGAQMSQALSQALFSAYARDVQLRARPRIDQRALEAVLASFN